MPALICKHCKSAFTRGTTHQCRTTGESYDTSDDDIIDFLLSAGVAAATDSAILGTLAGGSVLGGVVGDLLDGDLFD